MSEADSRRLAVAFLVALAATFLALHFQLARSARFVPDDLSQRANVATFGVLGAQRFMYRRWSGRWASNGMVALVMSVLREPRASFPFAVALLWCTVATAWTVAATLLRGRVRAVVVPLLAVVTVALLFCATPNRGDSWFFVFCALENVAPLCAALLALACVVRADEHAWLVVPAALLAALATACHESVALAVLATAGCALAAVWLRDHSDPRLRVGMIVVAIALLSFAVSATSPGSAARLAKMPRAPLPSAVWHAALDGPGVLLGIAREAALPLVVTFLVWAVALSTLARDDRTVAPIPARRVLAASASVLLLAPVIAFAATFPGFYSLGEPPPTRAQLVLAVFLVGAAVVLGSSTGAALREHARAAAVLVLLLAATTLRLGAVEVGRMRADIATARTYAAAYDARVAQLRAVKFERSRQPIVLDPLPPSGVLRSAEIRSDDQAAFENRSLRRMLGLGRPVIRAPGPDAPAG
jgi:hypothetical protein